jgi:hypothetical protein
VEVVSDKVILCKDLASAAGCGCVRVLAIMRVLVIVTSAFGVMCMAERHV